MNKDGDGAGKIAKIPIYDEPSAVFQPSFCHLNEATLKKNGENCALFMQNCYFCTYV